MAAAVVRLTHHGRPGSEVIPVDWAERHRPAAAGTMHSARCEIRGPDTRVDDPETNSVVTVPGALLYPLSGQDGHCRAQRINREQVNHVGEQRVITGDYLITVPFDVNGLSPDCLINFTQIDDADLRTRRIVINAVLRGSLRWERDLYCVDLDT